MRRLDVDQARDGLGGLVGTRSYATAVEPYQAPLEVRAPSEVLTFEEVELLNELFEFAGGKYPTVVVPSEIFRKVARIWAM